MHVRQPPGPELHDLQVLATANGAAPWSAKSLIDTDSERNICVVVAGQVLEQGAIGYG
jgi:hypothetical protein